MSSYLELPKDLPQPKDDGAADHLKGQRLPPVSLHATDDSIIKLGDVLGTIVIYCYPMTGQPNVPLPEGWDQIPGARGCTPQSCAFRDHYREIRALDAEVFGLSVQSTDYQKEMASRLHLPFLVLSDMNYEFQKALNLPTFETADMRLLKRITLLASDRVIKDVHYPVFPSDSDPDWVLDALRKLR
jgi:peroxiredoxin